MFNTKIKTAVEGSEKKAVKHTTEQLLDKTFCSVHFLFITLNAQLILKVNDLKFFAKIFVLNKYQQSNMLFIT